MSERPTPPGDIHALSGAYAVDALDDAERREFERHLVDCPDCRAEVAGLQETAATMSATTEVPPPPELRDRVLSGIAAVRPLPPADRDVAESAPTARTDAQTAAQTGAQAASHTAPVDLAARRRRRSRRLLAAAAAVVVLGGGGGAVVATHPWTGQESHQLSTADRVLRADDAKHVTLRLAGGAKATVTRSTSVGRAVITTSKMAAAPAGKVYELWLQDARGNMHPAGLMAGGDATTVLSGDAATSKAAAVTVEQGRVEQPTSQPIAFFDFGKST